MGLFFKKDDKKEGTGAGRSFAKTYDKEKTRPAIRCSISTGEQVAGFKDKRSGKFEEIALIKNDADLSAFKAQYGIEEMCEDSWRWQSMNPDGFGED